LRPGGFGVPGAVLRAAERRQQVQFGIRATELDGEIERTLVVVRGVVVCVVLLGPIAGVAVRLECALGQLGILVVTGRDGGVEPTGRECDGLYRLRSRLVESSTAGLADLPADRLADQRTPKLVRPGEWHCRSVTRLPQRRTGDLLGDRAQCRLGVLGHLRQHRERGALADDGCGLQHRPLVVVEPIEL